MPAAVVQSRPPHQTHEFAARETRHRLCLKRSTILWVVGLLTDDATVPADVVSVCVALL